MNHDDGTRDAASAGLDDASGPGDASVLHQPVTRDLEATGSPALDVSALHASMGHDDDEHDACAEALGRVHAFLSNQLPATEADLIRAHLDACEKCFDDFDIEATITRLLKRSCQSPCAPESLKVRVMGMRIDQID